MPTIDVTIAEGRSQEQLRTFIERLTEAAIDTVGATPENVTVILREVPQTRYARGNKTVSEINQELSR